MRRIKEWAESDRPRERMLEKGAHSLSDAELLAVLLGSGIKETNVLDLAKIVMASAGNNLLTLSRMGLEEFLSIRGIGRARAVILLAALELGRRRRDAQAQERVQVISSKDAFQYVESRLCDLQQEEFWVILLNGANKVLGMRQVSEGGWASTVVDPKVLFKIALEGKASCIILAHNHPSGQLSPSSADKKLTRRIVEGGKLLDIRVLDHIIVAGNSYYSFADNGDL